DLRLLRRISLSSSSSSTIDISNRFIYKNLVSCLIVVVDAAMVDVVVADVDTEVEDVRRRCGCGCCDGGCGYGGGRCEEEEEVV
ncbi:unnamed protein product, partial [Brassica rapa subsp. trilocularis]